MEQIGEVVDLISIIVEQTNLLALNASIEAARAGEAGEGFNVTTEIENRIEEVQETTDKTVDDIDQMSQRVESSAETIENTIEMFDEIAAAIEEAETGTTGQTAVEAGKNATAGTTDTTDLSAHPSATGRRATPTKPDSTTSESAAQSEKSPSDTESGSEQALLGVEKVGDTDMRSSTDSIPCSGLDGGRMNYSEIKSSNGRAKPSGDDGS